MLTLHVLGTPVLTGPSGPVTGRAAHKRRIALLSILAVARGRPVGRERLIALLWPEHPSDAARHTLSESLYVLRRELGDETFVTGGDEVALSPDGVQSDVGAFEEALRAGRPDKAVGHYGGPLLDGFYVSGAPEFERWVDTERDRLARACAGALERLASEAEEARRLPEAAEWWRALAVHDPYRSRVALRHSRALEAAGERAEALLSAEGHILRMREELGVEPDPAFLDYVAGLRAARVPAAQRSAGMRGGTRPSSGEGRTSEAPAADPEPECASAAGVTASAGNGAPEASAPALSGATIPASESTPLGGAPAPGGSIRSGGSTPLIRLLPLGESTPLPGSPPSRDGGSAEGGRESAVSAPPAVRTRVPRWWLRAAAAAALCAVALAATVPFLAERGREPASPRHDPRRIAVLYFEDDSPRGDLAYLARGLTGELIDELGRVPALDVVSRGAVRTYHERGVSLDSLVAALRVGSVVEGSVQRSGDSVRVTVRLVDTGSGSQLESRTVVRPIGELFSLERAVADEVSGFLRRRLGEEVRLRQAASETHSSRARDLLLRAEQAIHDASDVARHPHVVDAASAQALLTRADSLLALAEAADAAWTRPVVERGYVALASASLAPASGGEALLSAAAAHAERALAVEPSSAPALELRGRARWRAGAARGDTAELLTAAERDLRAAVESDSTRASAWAALSQLLRARGRLAESDLTARRALDQDAYLEDAPEILERLYFGAMARGDYAAARVACGRGSATFPVLWKFVECRLTLLREDPALPPDPARAWALVAELDRLDPQPRSVGRPYSPLYRQAAVAAVLARAGRVDSARAVLARARRQAGRDPELRLPLLLDEAYVAVLLDDRAGARHLIEAYLAERPGMRTNLARDVLFRGLVAPRARAPARGGTPRHPPAFSPAKRGSSPK